jgi:hypothetical protein
MSITGCGMMTQSRVNTRGPDIIFNQNFFLVRVSVWIRQTRQLGRGTPEPWWCETCIWHVGVLVGVFLFHEVKERQLTFEIDSRPKLHGPFRTSGQMPQKITTAPTGLEENLIGTWWRWTAVCRCTTSGQGRCVRGQGWRRGARVAVWVE